MNGRRIRKYCSHRCQRDLDRRHNLARWLATGYLSMAPTCPTHFVRRYLSQMQCGMCSICGLQPLWNGVTLAFVLDHVDGDSTNNARENLRLICPNCDSQLPTFKMRNRGMGRYSRRQRYAEGRSY